MIQESVYGTIDKQKTHLRLSAHHRTRSYLMMFVGFVLTGLTSVGPLMAESYYLRGGIGFDKASTTSFTDIDCKSQNPNALYGCGVPAQNLVRQSVGKFSDIEAFELGFGIDTLGPFRFESLIDYRPSLTFNGNSNFGYSREDIHATASSTSAMIATFFDIPMPGGTAKITPFIGAGIGLARNRISETTMNYNRTYTTVPAGHYSDLAHMLTFGFATPIAEHMTLDLSFRYSDLGKVRTGTGMGSVNWRDGSRSPLPLHLAPTQARLKTYGVRLSLRYSF